MRYNEWGEGTQIEPAVPRQGYRDYSSAEGGSNAYLLLTAKLAAEHRRASAISDDLSTGAGAGGTTANEEL